MSEHTPGPRYYFIVSVLLVVLADQLAKLAVVTFVPVYDSVHVIPNLLDITYVRNTGMAFGFLNESSIPYKPLVTGALACVALAGIALYARSLRPTEKWARAGMVLILGGAIGNILDRARLGYVIDFVDVYWHSWHFWAFNVADAAMTFGAIFVFLDVMVGSFNASRSV